MLEFLWVCDADEVRSERTRGTRLWERCSGAGRAACPFGILFGSDGEAAPALFETWSYFPTYLPAGLAIEIAVGTSLAELELFYLPFKRAGKPSVEANAQPSAFRRVRYVAVGVRDLAALSDAAQSVQGIGQVRYFAAAQPLMIIAFAGETSQLLDFRPGLPLVFRSGAHLRGQDLAG